MATDEPTAQAVAEATRDAMWPADRASQALGMRILSIGPGSAVISMTVRADMLNGLAICHGGLITTLADSTFAYACNAYNDLTVASGFDVNLMSSARQGDVLTATATEVARTRRTGLYDIDVRDQNGKRIASFRGRSSTMLGKLIVPTLRSTRGD